MQYECRLFVLWPLHIAQLKPFLVGQIVGNIFCNLVFHSNTDSNSNSESYSYSICQWLRRGSHNCHTLLLLRLSAIKSDLIIHFEWIVGGGMSIHIVYIECISFVEIKCKWRVPRQRHEKYFKWLLRMRVTWLQQQTVDKDSVSYWQVTNGSAWKKSTKKWKIIVPQSSRKKNKEIGKMHWTRTHTKQIIEGP